MKLILCRNRSMGSWLLRCAMWSRWSHSAIWDERDGVVYDSTFLQRGVRSHRAQDFYADYPVHEVRELSPGTTDSQARAWLMAQVGKPYDWTALLAFVFHRDWSAEDA